MDNTTLMIAGASGNLGRAAAEHLAARCGDRLILGSRSTMRLADLKDKVRDVRSIDFDDPRSLAEGFDGVDRLLLISTGDLGTGRRVEQHRAAIEAAGAAGVGHVVYTSITRPEAGALLSIAPDHLATEQALMASGLGWTILRNNCYLDFALMGLIQALGRGSIDSAAGDGAIGYVTRADCALAAASALEREDRDNCVYDVTGPAALTITDLAELASAITGVELAVHQVGADELRTAMTSAGLPPPLVDLIVSTDLAAAEGQLAVTSNDTASLTGRVTTSAEAFMRQYALMLVGAAASRQAG